MVVGSLVVALIRESGPLGLQGFGLELGLYGEVLVKEQILFSLSLQERRARF